MLDIPLQQSGILTFMSLKKLMSVQAAIVRPTHPPPSSLPPSSSCSTKRKCFISTIGSAVTKITLYSVKTVYRDFEGERTQFFSPFDGRHPSTATPLAPLSALLFGNRCSSLPPFVTRYLSAVGNISEAPSCLLGRGVPPSLSPPTQGQEVHRSKAWGMMSCCFPSQVAPPLLCTHRRAFEVSRRWTDRQLLSLLPPSTHTQTDSLPLCTRLCVYLSLINNEHD